MHFLIFTLLNSISKCNNWDVDDKIIDNFIVMN